jgi:hypothetical protein
MAPSQKGMTRPNIVFLLLTTSAGAFRATTYLRRERHKTNRSNAQVSTTYGQAPAQAMASV